MAKTNKEYTVICHYPERTPEEEERRNEEIAKILLGVKLRLIAGDK